MGDKLIHSFLQEPEHRKIYETYLQNPIETNKELVESKFKLYVMKLKVLTYFSKVLFHEAQRFDRKIKLSTALPLLDDDDNSKGYSHTSDNPTEIIDDPSLGNLFENERLYNIVSNLNDNNKKLLYLLYVKDLNEDQTAQKLGITKQAVNKRKNILLKKIRNLYNE